MSRKASNCKRVMFSPDMNENPSVVYLKHGSAKKGSGNKRRVDRASNLWPQKNSGFSPVKLLRRLSAKVARVIRLVSLRKRKSSTKVTSSSLARSRSYVGASDSHLTEDIEDCIQFINSSSLPRSSSVSTSCP
ncbi:hypothetical protein GIB67_027390 [Kingdonia uniflora]|uniref:Josephin-like protein n=1 Tax=Kingdonia uniflora TaxID=39325 RepID=A0A7J7MF37_9MAGN|nr:hypothetical protein GIB67_027390 [Kingdonia uniflora]